MNFEKDVASKKHTRDSGGKWLLRLINLEASNSNFDITDRKKMLNLRKIIAKILKSLIRKLLITKELENRID